MKNNDMDIVCCLDNNYVMPVGVMMCSLCENNKNEKITFHVIGTDLTDKTKDSFRHIVIDKYHKAICFYGLDGINLSILPISQSFQLSHINSLATYYRLFLTEVLPKHISKVLYLDGDIIVRHSLTKLWNTDITNVPLAATIDVEAFNCKYYNRLKYSQHLGYFNAGVLLINLSYWREHNVLNDFNTMIKQYPERLGCFDQDVLNSIFCKNKKELRLTYNFQNDFLFKQEYRQISWEYDEEVDEVFSDPCILHFISAPKPWHKDCDYPYQYEWHKYQSLTEWKDIPLKRYFSRFHYFVNWIIRCSMRLGLITKRLQYFNRYREDLKFE